MGYISLRSILNAIIGITSCQYEIVKMVILHDATKTIQNRVFVFSKKRTNTRFFQKKRNGLKKKQKTQVDCVS